jgi:hypothetical protein
MQLENRYLVLKRKEIEQLSESSKIQLLVITKEIEQLRRDNNKQPLDCIVIESDWPEYSAAKTVLLSRIRYEAHAEAEHILKKGTRIEVIDDTDLIIPAGTKATISFDLDKRIESDAICKLDGLTTMAALPLKSCRVIA